MQRKNSFSVVTLPESAQKIVSSYQQCTLAGKTFPVPYFMNEKGKKGLRVSVGKGTAQEIITETIRLAKKYGFDLSSATPSTIRSFMIAKEIGIDCSGFVAWILDVLVQKKLHKRLWQVLDFSMLPLRAQLKRHIRPIENISVRVLTNEKNSRTIPNLTMIKVGDMVRMFNGHHILLISEVTYNNQDKAVSFRYVNSTEYKDRKYGIHEGSVRITKPTKYLVDQKWDSGKEKHNFIFETIKKYYEDSRVVRLKALQGQL
jgi:hypothetical protein